MEGKKSKQIPKGQTKTSDDPLCTCYKIELGYM